ncbi:unnamed protein product [Pedinophyceae sp. YPF-701]|nr:unnamed protein product [Pedinophyceae sp. YPF-701]
MDPEELTALIVKRVVEAAVPVTTELAGSETKLDSSDIDLITEATKQKVAGEVQVMLKAAGLMNKPASAPAPKAEPKGLGGGLAPKKPKDSGPAAGLGGKGLPSRAPKPTGQAIAAPAAAPRAAAPSDPMTALSAMMGGGARPGGSGGGMPDLSALMQGGGSGGGGGGMGGLMDMAAKMMQNPGMADVMQKMEQDMASGKGMDMGAMMNAVMQGMGGAPGAPGGRAPAQAQRRQVVSWRDALKKMLPSAADAERWEQMVEADIVTMARSKPQPTFSTAYIAGERESNEGLSLF